MDLSLFENFLYSLFFAIAFAIFVSKLQGKRFNLPPGPVPLPVLGSWLEVGNNLTHHDFARYAKKFGEVFLLKMGKLNIAVVSSKEGAKEVLLTQGVEFGSRSRNIVFDIFTGKGQDMIFTEYGEHWRKMRRIATVPFFTSKVVEKHRRGWEEEAAEMVAGVEKDPIAAKEGIVLRKRIELMVYNNVYRVMFGMRFESEEDPLFVKIKGVNAERSKLGQSVEYNFGEFIPILRPFMSTYLRSCKEVTRKRLQLFKESFVEERKKLKITRTKDNKDLACGFDHILEAEQRGEINEDNVLYMVENMNIAAIDTTIWALEWAVAELINNPEVQTKLRDEIDTVIGPSEPITEPKIHKLPYLQAFIKETLRHRMVVPCLLPHMNLNDAKLNDFHIPAKSRIFVNAWWLANDPTNWKKPEEFRPERFLEEECKVEANGNDIKYIPFGVGRRSCPGILMAMPILGITVGMLVQKFELLCPLGQSKIDMTETNGQFATRIKKHYTVVLKPRSL